MIPSYFGNYKQIISRRINESEKVTRHTLYKYRSVLEKSGSWCTKSTKRPPICNRLPKLSYAWTKY